MKGLFITFEGPDGSGKTTQIHKLSEHFENKGFEVLITREPGGTEISEKIRKIILDPENKEMCDMAEALLYAASRAQHVSELIKPALEQGKVVISDRFMDSSIAYQGFARGLGDCVRIINEYAVQGVYPDVTFFMNIKPEDGIKRAASRDKLDRIELENIDFHKRVYDAYLELSEVYKDRFVIVDAAQSIEDVFSQIISVIEDRIEC